MYNHSFLMISMIVHVLIAIIACRSKSESQDLYIITITHKRLEQAVNLMQMSYTLRLVDKVTWLVIEDGFGSYKLVEELLLKSGIKFVYLLTPRANRNTGIQWIRNNAYKGVVYFADEDYTYDLDLFTEIRNTKKISIFPVGLVTSNGFISPIVNNCNLTGFYDAVKMKFQDNFAGFAISVDFLSQQPDAKVIGSGTDFFENLAPFKFEEADLVASCCTKILVWHIQIEKSGGSLVLGKNHKDTNLMDLKTILG